MAIYKESNYLLFKRGLRLFKGRNVPGAMFIQEGTFIPDSRVAKVLLSNLYTVSTTQIFSWRSSQKPKIFFLFICDDDHIVISTRHGQTLIFQILLGWSILFKMTVISRPFVIATVRGWSTWVRASYWHRLTLEPSLAVDIESLELCRELRALPIDWAIILNYDLHPF